MGNVIEQGDILVTAMNKPPFIHPKAIVESRNVGSDTRVWAFAHILKHAKIGRNCNICDFVFIENDVVVGDDVTIKCGVYIWDGITIEDKVFVGPSVTFTNDPSPRSKAYLKHHPKTVLREGCSIGANSVLTAGIVVGRYAMTGVGSVLTKDVGDFELVYGNPARHQGFVCICSEKLHKETENIYSCDCGLKYILGENGLRQTESFQVAQATWAIS